jgi:hypothetical protein
MVVADGVMSDPAHQCRQKYVPGDKRMNNRFLAIFAATTFILGGAASGAEVKRKIEIDGDKAEVWAKLGGWCAIKDWHPVIAKCEETTEGGKKRRVLTTKDGGVIKETQLTATETGYTYQIDESPLPVANYTASFAVVPDNDDKEEINVVWSAKFDPKGKTEAEAKAVIDGIFKAGLDEIEKQQLK